MYVYLVCLSVCLTRLLQRLGDEEHAHVPLADALKAFNGCNSCCGVLSIQKLINDWFLREERGREGERERKRERGERREERGRERERDNLNFHR